MLIAGGIRTITGHILSLGAIAAGQLENSLTLVDPETRTAAGRALAHIDVSDDLRDYQIPLGSKAQVAIYSEHLHDLSLLRKILLRMKSWENYVFLEGHHGSREGHHGSREEH